MSYFWIWESYHLGPYSSPPSRYPLAHHRQRFDLVWCRIFDIFPVASSAHHDLVPPQPPLSPSSNDILMISNSPAYTSRRSFLHRLCAHQSQTRYHYWLPATTGFRFSCFKRRLKQRSPWRVLDRTSKWKVYRSSSAPFHRSRFQIIWLT